MSRLDFKESKVRLGGGDPLTITVTRDEPFDHWRVKVVAQGIWQFHVPQETLENSRRWGDRGIKTMIGDLAMDAIGSSLKNVLDSVEDGEPWEPRSHTRDAKYEYDPYGNPVGYNRYSERVYSTPVANGFQPPRPEPTAREWLDLEIESCQESG